jgi:hypothetical protein
MQWFKKWEKRFLESGVTQLSDHPEPGTISSCLFNGQGRGGYGAIYKTATALIAWVTIFLYRYWLPTYNRYF